LINDDMLVQSLLIALNSIL